MRMFRKGYIKNNMLHWQTAKMNLLVTSLTVRSLRKLKTAKFIELRHRILNVDLLPSHTQSLV